MAEQTGLLSELLTKTDALISSLLWNSWDQIDSAINGWAEAMFILYIMTVGLEVFLGFSDDIWRVARNLMRGLIVYAIATNMPLLFDVSLEVTQDVPVAISDVIIGELGADESTLGKLDEYYVKAGDMALAITNAAGWSLWVGLGGLLIWLVSFIFIALVAVTLILAKLGFAVLFSVAPIFVVCYMFSATRPLFNGWLQQTINLALIPLFVYLLLAICAAFSEYGFALVEESGTADDELNFVDITPILLTSIASIYLILQVTTWSSAVAGGIGLQVGGPSGTAGRAGRAGMNWVRGKFKGG